VQREEVFFGLRAPGEEENVDSQQKKRTRSRLSASTREKSFQKLPKEKSLKKGPETSTTIPYGQGEEKTRPSSVTLS